MFSPGDKVRIIFGCMRGYEAKVISVKDNKGNAWDIPDAITVEFKDGQLNSYFMDELELITK